MHSMARKFRLKELAQRNGCVTHAAGESPLVMDPTLRWTNGRDLPLSKRNMDLAQAFGGDRETRGRLEIDHNGDSGKFACHVPRTCL